MTGFLNSYFTFLVLVFNFLFLQNNESHFAGWLLSYQRWVLYSWSKAFQRFWFPYASRSAYAVVPQDLFTRYSEQLTWYEVKLHFRDSLHPVTAFIFLHAGIFHIWKLGIRKQPHCSSLCFLLKNGQPCCPFLFVKFQYPVSGIFFSLGASVTAELSFGCCV